MRPKPQTPTSLQSNIDAAELIELIKRSVASALTSVDTLAEQVAGLRQDVANMREDVEALKASFAAPVRLPHQAPAPMQRRVYPFIPVFNEPPRYLATEVHGVIPRHVRLTHIG
jgi:hypothetical protein